MLLQCLCRVGAWVWRGAAQHRVRWRGRGVWRGLHEHSVQPCAEPAAHRLRPPRPPASIRPASAMRASAGRPPASGQPRPIGAWAFLAGWPATPAVLAICIGGKASAKATLRSVMACDGAYFELLYTALTMLSPTAPLALRSHGTKDPLRTPQTARTPDQQPLDPQALGRAPGRAPRPACCARVRAFPCAGSPEPSLVQAALPRTSAAATPRDGAPSSRPARTPRCSERSHAITRPRRAAAT